MTDGVRLTLPTPPRRRWLWRALTGLIFYLALWGGVLNCISLGWGEGLPLLFTPGGWTALLNRLMAASAARQSYVYTMLAGGGFVLPAGVLTGALCVFGLGRAALFLLITLGGAYLGLTPEAHWLVLLAAAGAVSLFRPPETGWKGGALAQALCIALLVLICAGTFALFPGESPALSAWEERARDTLATSTVAYAEQWSPPEDASAETPPPQEEQTAEDEPIPPDWSFLTRRSFGPALIVILLLALALFVPSVWRDRLRKRQKENRAGLNDPDPGSCIRHSLPYALRWLVLGGLTADNVPFGEYAGQIGARFSPELGAEFSAVLPIWQEAVWSDHPMSEEQRARVKFFTELCRAAAKEKMGRKQRFMAAYVYAL